MSRLPVRLWTGGLAALLLSVPVPPPAAAQIWPQFYDPMVIRALNLTMSAQDWDAVRNDLTFTLEVPAQLSMGAEPPILVAVRRKSGVAIPMEGGPEKVALKIDINQYTEQSWHGMKKLSLENGGDTSTLLEGFAWYLHRLAWMPGGYPYMPGLASWATVTVNGHYYGVYVNVEQVDKRSQEWRGVWLSDDTWLYKQSDSSSPPTIEFGPLTHSPTYNALCYSPFPPQSCPTPPPATVAEQLAALIDMQAMLTLGAVNAWCYSPDDLFAQGKNHFFSDSRYRKRFYYPWDLDANFGDLTPSHSIYALSNSPYVTVILDNPTFRSQYNAIMQALIDGPLATANLTAALNNLESALLSVMSTDPYNPVTASDFNALRNYVSARNVNVASQLASSVSAPTTERPASPSAHPNPSSAQTSVEFRMERPGPARVSVFDAQGARVRTLVDGQLDAGVHHVNWEGTDEHGRAVRAGVYFVSCQVEGRTWSQRVVRLR